MKLEPLKAGAAATMTVKGKNTVTINDVLVGEVWLASGQSNMHFMSGNVGEWVNAHGLKKNYLDYETPTTNWVNYHFRRWYVPFLDEWIYERVGPADKLQVLNKMLEMGRSVLAHRNDRFGRFLTQYGRTRIVLRRVPA